jgi:D-alanine transaminase
MQNSLPAFPCYLNGQFSTIDKAQISVMDRGFIFGDGVYEVVPFYQGKPFGMQGHIDRLEGSLKETRIRNPYTPDQWMHMFEDLCKKGDASTDQIVYLQVSRGVALRDHVMPKDITPTVFAFVQPMKTPSAQMRAQGVACVSAPDFRWLKAHIKSISLLGSVFSRQISADAGAVETIMFRGELLSEAAASNVWVVKNRKVMGPKSDHRVLRGIRYGAIQTIANSKGIDFELCDITRTQVLEADELLLSSATKEVLSITQLDERPVADGKPGPIYAQLYAGYQELKKSGF